MAVTQKQLQAIQSDGTNILVSASAGSGCFRAPDPLFCAFDSA